MDQNHQFATTQWSVIRQAAGSDSIKAKSALERLCESYWYPLYSFVRFKGHDAAEAEDLTQSFFVSLLQREDIKSAKPELGRFRSFLLGAMKNFMANEWHKKNAQKRGGGKAHFSIDFSNADNRYQNEDFRAEAPDQAFEKQWAMTLLDRVNQMLRTEHQNKGKAHAFDVLSPFLGGKNQQSTLANAAAELGVTEVAAKVAVHRMRARFGHLLRMEIQSTLESEEHIEDEIRRLFEALRAD